MKKKGFCKICALFAGILSLAACSTNAGSSSPSSSDIPSSDSPSSSPTIIESPSISSEEEIVNHVYAHIGENVLDILLSDNSSAEAFADLLREGDVTVDMEDYGNFEKVGDLRTSLPRNDERITTEPGDVILYQGDHITIYYDVNIWTFTRLGKVQDRSQAELISILGEGDVSVTFSLK